mgnify:CR=1 FL=1
MRDRLLASNFGVSPQTDAYTAAFRIPDLLFTLIVSGAFAVSFIPVFIGYLEKKKEAEAWRVANSILNILLLVTGAACVIAFIFASPLVTLLTPGFDSARHDLTVNITRIMLATPIFFVISSVFGAIQQSFNRFLIYALSSLFYNVGIIIGILVFSKFFDTNPIYGVAYAGSGNSRIAFLLLCLLAFAPDGRCWQRCECGRYSIPFSRTTDMWLGLQAGYEAARRFRAHTVVKGSV